MTSKREKKRKARSLRRAAPSRESYDRVLIVCEGSKTEPLYFREIVDELELSTANISITGEGGSSPISVVEYAVTLYQQDAVKGGGYDKVYCVIDKDTHDSYSAAVEKIKELNPKNVFSIISSVPCFEYWVLLHFEFTTQAFTRTDNRSPCSEVIARVKRHINNYNKGSRGLYSLIGDKTDKAMRNAERANRDARSVGTDNPTTHIGSLIQYLRTIK